MQSERERYRVLAGISRSRLLAVLRQARAPMAIRDLADAVALHPNTAREHLEQLVAAALVRSETAQPAGRGRPGLRYIASGPSGPDDSSAYQALAGVLAAELASRPAARQAAIAAGERWGHSAAGRLPPTPKASDAVERLADLLDDAGFAPERPATAQQPIRLRHCPFRPLAQERGEIVCNVHLGLMRGALHELRAPLDALSLEPFVEPDLCLVHLGARTDAG
jgi:predicted ArsR family transcriptional regulator